MKRNKYRTHGTGEFARKEFYFLGENVIFERNVLVFHPENIRIGNNVYIGHNTILKGYHKNKMVIGENSWLGQNCFLHSAGGLYIGEAVGIGPCVKIITSEHDTENPDISVLYNRISFKSVTIESGVDIGVGTTILPGVKIGKNAVVGAGAVVNADLPPYSISVGVPARVIRYRK